MKYALLMYADPEYTQAMSRAEIDAVKRRHEVLGEELQQSGEILGGSGLDLPRETTVLRLGSDGTVATKGPLATDTTEHLTAYYEIECKTPERAHEIAARVLDDHVTAVELRGIHDTADT
jgi:hypothetical protein